MSHDAPIESEQLSMLADILNAYCNEAGIPEGHPAREHFGRRLISLFQSGVTDASVLRSKMNDGYEEWLGEIGAKGYFHPPKLSAKDRLVGDNILPRSDLRGKSAARKYQ